MHVDDFQVMGPDLKKIDQLMHSIENLDKTTLKLSQGQYARTLIERHGLKDCKPANTPMERLMEPSSTQC